MYWNLTAKHLQASRLRKSQPKEGDCMKHTASSSGVGGDLTSANVPGERSGKTTAQTGQPGIFFRTMPLAARHIDGARTGLRQSAIATSFWSSVLRFGMAKIRF